MILKLAYYGDPILRKKAALIPVVNEEIKQLAADMIETMHHLKNGIGLAAPQIHQSVSLFVVQFPDTSVEERYAPGLIEIFINPKLLEVSDEGWYYSEGCLSLPGLYQDVPRPQKITIQFQGLDGELIVRTYEGYEARMVLHENDHLNGVLFIDRIDPKIRKEIEPQLRAIKNTFYKNFKDFPKIR
jgi:peptide deformylase